MGWLRELMRSSPERPRSFGEVARAALASPSWTARPLPKPRSLAALLSKLDRGVDLGWLADRPAVQAALAEALGV
ncbi:MAG: hypothetical protein FJ104_15520, partial [Deltaproteobacteria bacterium]|nr:hypothetical protein [Deltaproteobacteria bacterium]